jgi:guanylate kinase
MLTSKELRQKFLDFFASKGHTVLPSSSLVPKEDPTVLFNTAGMQPIVPYLLGQKHPGGTRLVNSQKCIRTDDIDEVGDNRHATFFEMLGFWSLGDYFKEETIEWMFEFLTAKEWLGLDPKRLFVTVYKGNSKKSASENLENLESENSSESFINEVESDEEAVVFWQKQFEKLGIYADVGEEFDFKQAKIETTIGGKIISGENGLEKEPASQIISKNNDELEQQLLILVGPSGSGKSTLTRHLLEENSDFTLSISCTTREPRIGEVNGREYYFISREEFQNRIKNSDFVEWEEVYNGVFYGTLRSEIERIWTIGKIPIFDIDYAGGLNLKKMYPQAIDIFLEAPSVEVLEERLRARGTETEEKIQMRIAKAKTELEYKNRFSNVVINREWLETIEIINLILLEKNKNQNKIEQVQNQISNVFFASTNSGKIADFKNALKNENIQILTLNDLDYEIPEPLENGANNLENAEIKARHYWQNLKVKMPVIAQDNAKFLDGVAETDQPGKDIKGIVKTKFGNSEPETMVQFYQELANKYGGLVRTVENLGICLFDGQNICKEIVEFEAFLGSTAFGEIQPDYPMSVLSKVKINGEMKFWQELTSKEQQEFLQPLTTTYQKLISDLKVLDKIKVIFIHGGDSFDSYDEYLLDLQNSSVKFQDGRLRWKDSLGDFLGSDYQVYRLSMPNSNNANYEEWRIQFEKIQDILDEKTVLIGHSLGGIFLAKYLAEQKLTRQISQLHLVAAPFEKVGSFILPSSLDLIEQSTNQIYLYHSQDDFVVDFGELTKYQKHLPKAQSLIFRTHGHFLQSEFPELVEQIKKNKRLDKSPVSKIERTTQNPNLELEKPEKYIYRITKKSGKDNWWGLPYRGPCGPCSEVYYLLEKNPTDFEQSLFPTMNLDEIENFIENDIVEIGNNVFMMYEGEKDANKEPINLKPLAKKNIDTGLGFERFLTVVNGMNSIYETDCLKPIVDVAKKWSKVG